MLWCIYSSPVRAETDLEYGAFLASVCTSCHLMSSKKSNIPSIIGWEEKDLIAVLVAYKKGLRKHLVMNSIASGLGPGEMASLAAYFAGLNPTKEKQY